MATLSSKATFFYKRILPALIIGFLIIFIFVPIPFIVARGTSEYPALLFLAASIVTIVFLSFRMKKLIFDMVDEVVDLGDALLIKNGRREARIALSDIVNINYTPLRSPPRVILSLRKPSIFGTEVMFCAPVHFAPSKKSPVIDQLIARVDAARRNSN